MKKGKVRKIAIIVLAVAAVGTGGVFGVRHFLANRGGSVEVVPVSNLDAGQWLTYGDDMGTSGTVVSDVNQEVYVPENKVIQEVYVDEGDTVKIGDKLLSYDTTILELDKELQELTVQSLDLEIKSAEADLAKLRNTTPVERSAESTDDTGVSSDLEVPKYITPTFNNDDDDSSDTARLVTAERTVMMSQDADASSGEAQEAALSQETQTQTEEQTVQAENQAAQTEQSETVAPPQTQTDEGNTAGQIQNGGTQESDTQESQTSSENSQTPSGESTPSEEIILGDDTAQTTESSQITDGILDAGKLGETENLQNVQPKMNQSLKELLANIRIKENTEQGEVLAADTAQQAGEPVTAQITGQNSLNLILHFKENAEHHFERLNTYTMLFKGITLQSEKAGKLYGTAVIDGNDYPEIGGYTLTQEASADAQDVVRLTIAFHEGLEQQHELSSELEDSYIEIPLAASEVTADTLIFRTDSQENDKTIAIERPQQETETPETETAATELLETITESEEAMVLGTESPAEPGTPSEDEAEPKTEAKVKRVKVNVTWNHKDNEEIDWPQTLTFRFYDQNDEEQETMLHKIVIQRNSEAAGDPSYNGEDEPETETESLAEGTSEEGNDAQDDLSAVISQDNVIAEETEETTQTSDWTWPGDTAEEQTAAEWPESLSAPDTYKMVSKVSDPDVLYVMSKYDWDRDGEDPETMVCNIIMDYVPTDDNPLAKLEPLSLLNYRSGTEKRYYKGSGTKEDPFVFFCTDGARIESSFVNWVLGFNEDGTERIAMKDGDDPAEFEEILNEDGTSSWVRRGYYVVLEIREADSITGAFIRSVGLDGTVKVEHGYGPGTYWIFTSNDGMVRYEEEIPEEDNGDFGGGGDFDGGDDLWSDVGETYTAEELAEAIAEQERTIRSLKLDRRKAELELGKYERQLEESTVLSSVNGFVKTIGGSTDGSEAYMVVASNGGLYLKTTVSELSLDTVKKGDTLKATSWETQNKFEASVTEINYYPSSTTNDSWSGGNVNSSSYPVLAYIEDSDGLSVYEQVSVTFPSAEESSGDIYLPKAYIRSENGQSYVYKADENGRLKKQYIHTGGTLYDYVDIKEGLESEDYIAFPYGKSVKDGAKTEVSSDGFIS
ncbi:MAG: hypothetical protein Q4C50_11335 [Eubacteriales bacterium]|nr:hypothetical protein [Eubacteriales bacterium]